MTQRDLFEILAREHADSLRVFLRCAVRDDALTDDLFQETLLTAWKNLDRFDKSRPFGPWLRGIAAKLVLAQRRRDARGLRLCDDDVLEHIEGRLADLQRQPGDTLDEKLDGLRECVGALPPAYRQVVNLRYEEELRGASLAARLETSLENAKKRLQRAREKLLECLRRRLAAAAV